MDGDQQPSGHIDVGELRERLRALGYLNAGVDRFVLAPAQQERTAAALAWRLSVRIGLLAALLLGPAAAAGVALRFPGLITGPRDAVVITVYLAIIFGAVATALSLLAALIVRALASRRSPATVRRVAVTAGWLVGILTLAYLTLWWNATGDAWTAPGRTLIAVAAAVAVSLLLGHAVIVAGLALLVREQSATVGRAPTTSWRALVGVGAVAFVGASSLLAWSAAHAAAASTAAPEFTVVPTGLRVIVIAIDGFDRRLFESISKAETLGALPSLNEQGIAVMDRDQEDPAAIWTTVATGVSAEEHGVSGLELRRVAGLEGAVGATSRSTLAAALGAVTDLARLTTPVPVSGTARRHKTFWEVAAEKGLEAVAVNWWATWPANNTTATVISDRALLRLERGGPQNAEIAPDSLYEPLRARWPAIKARARALAKAGITSAMPNEAYDVVLRSATLDAEQVFIARDPLLGTPDVLAVYLPGLDIAQHALFQETGGVSLSPSAMAARVDALRHYYVFLDRLLAEWLPELPRDAAVLTITHPGRVGGELRPSIWLRGGPIRKSLLSGPGTPSLAAVNPTVCYLLGLPVSREVEGGPELLLLDDEFVGGHPVRYVQTYGRYAAEVPRREGTPLDQETLERLRSLGYIR
jgi:hypothetical protein